MNLIKSMSYAAPQLSHWPSQCRAISNWLWMLFIHNTHNVLLLSSTEYLVKWSTIFTVWLLWDAQLPTCRTEADPQWGATFRCCMDKKSLEKEILRSFSKKSAVEMNKCHLMCDKGFRQPLFSAIMGEAEDSAMGFSGHWTRHHFVFHPQRTQIATSRKTRPTHRLIFSAGRRGASTKSPNDTP